MESKTIGRQHSMVSGNAGMSCTGRNTPAYRFAQVGEGREGGEGLTV